MNEALAGVRSLLFVPGDRADMIAKVPRSAPDAVVVDLEDAVARADKDTARRTAVAAIEELDVPDTVVLVRVNPSGSPWFSEDVAAAIDSAADGVVLPKLESLAEVAVLRQELGNAAVLVAGLETARGVADCRGLLGLGIDAAYFGAEDYIADIGGRRTPGGDEVLYARSLVCLAARLTGVVAIDQAVVAVRDDERFVADAQAGRAIGYPGKICLHPRQVELAHQVFTPTDEEVAHARAVVEAAEGGVGVLNGQMVDEVHIRMATAVLARAGDMR